METAQDFFKKKLYSLASDYIMLHQHALQDVLRSTHIETSQFIKKHCNGKATEIIDKQKISLDVQDYCEEFSNLLVPKRINPNFYEQMRIAHPGSKLVDKMTDYTLFLARIETMYAEINPMHNELEMIEQYYMNSLFFHLKQVDQKGNPIFHELPNKLASGHSYKLSEFELFKFRNNQAENEDISNYVQTYLYEQLIKDTSSLLVKELENNFRNLN